MKHPKGAYRARKTLQKFGYIMLRQIRAFFSTSLIVLKNLKGGPFGSFNISSVAKYQTIEGTFEGIKKISENLTKPKKGEHLRVPKKLKRDPSDLEWFCILCLRLWKRSKSHTEYLM